MSPKFRGGSDDWLDDEDSARAQRGGARKATGSKGQGKATSLPLEEANAIVAEVFPNQCRVKLLADGRELLCAFKRAHVFQKGEIRERSPVATGDLVLVRDLGTVHAGMSQGLVEGVCARKNCLYRPAPGREGEKIHHVIAANLDRVVIVASEREPEFSPGLVDRFLVAAQAAGIEPLICATKCDLTTTEENKPWNLYASLGFPVFETSSKRGDGIESLHEMLLGQAVLFCGHSGVGKTSLLRALLGAEIGRVGEVSQVTGKGRHTTTSTVLLGGPQGSRWIDSPGIREFGLADIDPDRLVDYFPEFSGLGCGKPGCNHEGLGSQAPEGCRAAALPRYSSYRRILESLRTGER